MELNAYRVMWLFVFFDLPTDTKRDKKNASKFRQDLLKSGFQMMQYSVYTRHCASFESADAYERRINQLLPPYGKVSVLRITDKQFGNMSNFWGRVIVANKDEGMQLELF